MTISKIKIIVDDNFEWAPYPRSAPDKDNKTIICLLL